MLLPLYGGGFFVAYAQLIAFYYAVGCILHFVVPALVKTHSVQQAERKPGSVARDAFYSLGPLAVKAAVWVCVEELHRRGWALTYGGPVKTWAHAAYMCGVIVLLDWLHDAWFYWTHRLLHWGPLYRHVHFIHHKSNIPSAFTGYSFHLVEAAIVFANEVLVCWLMPIHMGLHRIYHIWTTAIHEGGHVGYEMAPFIPSLQGLATLLLCGKPRPSPSTAEPSKDGAGAAADEAVTPGEAAASGAAGALHGAHRALNTVRHHDMHHRFPNRHFSLYFTHWDRWCGTLHDKYDAIVAQHFGEVYGKAGGKAGAGEHTARPASAGDAGSSRAASEAEAGADEYGSVEEAPVEVVAELRAAAAAGSEGLRQRGKGGAVAAATAAVGVVAGGAEL